MGFRESCKIFCLCRLQTIYEATRDSGWQDIQSGRYSRQLSYMRAPNKCNGSVLSLRPAIFGNLRAWFRTWRVAKCVALTLEAPCLGVLALTLKRQ